MGTKAFCNYSASLVGDGGILRELSSGFRATLATYQLGRSNTCCSCSFLCFFFPTLPIPRFASDADLFSLFSHPSSQSLWISALPARWLLRGKIIKRGVVFYNLSAICVIVGLFTDTFLLLSEATSITNQPIKTRKVCRSCIFIKAK